MLEKLDLRGKLCPEPVIASKKILDKLEVVELEALVDDDVCVANLERLARSLKAHFSFRPIDGYFSVSISKNTKSLEESSKFVPAQVSADNSKTGMVVFISKEQLGDGDPDFGKTLANVFLQTMFESGHKPRAILMANTGVKLLASQSSCKKVLDDFKIAGVEVFACGLCVDYYGLKQEINKEQITNMFAICEYLSAAEKVVQF